MSDDRKERPVRFTTVSDMPIEPLYGPAGVEPEPQAADSRTKARRPHMTAHERGFSMGFSES